MNEGIKIIEKFDDVFMLMKLLEKYLNPSITEQQKSIEEYCHKLIDKGIVIGCTNPNHYALIAGYCNNYETKVAYISSIIITPELRGKGIGTTLIQVFEKYALDRGMRCVKLEVFNINKKVASFYIKQGYFIDETMEESFYMCKHL